MSVPVKPVETVDDLPELRCPSCGETIERGNLGGIPQGQFIVWFHDRDHCRVVLGVSQ